MLLQSAVHVILRLSEERATYFEEIRRKIRKNGARFRRRRRNDKSK